MTTAVLLGVLQGVTEWLPVSSEGIVAAAYTLLEGRSLDEAVGLALWLHVGTLPAALIALRREVAQLCTDLVRRPTPPTPLLLFLVLSTSLSVVLGLPLALGLGALSGRVGASVMALIGGLMLVTGAAQMRGREPGHRDRSSLVLLDALAAGVAQGVSVLPGFSRSGLTVAALLARGIEKREAFILSFLMSIPASAAGGLFAITKGWVILSAELMAAAAVAFVFGLVTIRGLLSLAQRVSFGPLAVLLGLVLIAASAWELLAG